MNRKYLLLIVIITNFTVATAAHAFSASALRGTKAPDNAVWVDELISDEAAAGVKAAASSAEGPLMMSGVIYPHGIGAFPSSVLVINLNKSARGFAAMVGVDNFSWNKQGRVVFEIWVDGEIAAESKPLRFGDAPERLRVNLKDAERLMLMVRGLDDVPIAADWGGSVLALDPDAADKPEVVTYMYQVAMPIAHTDLNEVGIHGPRVVGSTPGNDFIFKIPATGKAPLSFSAVGLPAGLSLDPDAGIITGTLQQEGDVTVTLRVTAQNGEAERELKIVGGTHKLALTPPMGWNSWNVWGTSVDDAKVRAAADAMIASGLAAFGYQYVNIDDAWEAGRAADGEIQTNEKFPDMKSLGDYVHSKGLKLGIYSSPGPKTCAGYEGSWEHEYQDAATWAKWGIDYLKHDWCGYRVIAKDDSREELMKPYLHMREALDASGRDIVFSLCQYGMGNVWEWGAQTGGNLWRTTGDIVDTWPSMSGIGFSQNGLEKHSGPGHWNDPDMLVVGSVGWGPSVHPTRLSPNEQITHITLWSMLSAPLLIGCDMPAMDDFTRDLLTNTEVIDVNQDPLGRQARRVAEAGVLLEVWARPLYDGTTAVALFNRFVEDADIIVDWGHIGVVGPQPVRDLWQRRDLGAFDGEFTTRVPAHGAVLLKIGDPR